MLTAEAPRPRHAGALVLEALQAFLPPRRVSVADWAAQHRWVEGAHPGRWDPSYAPYLNEPMEALTSDLHTTTCLVGPGQCGKTSIAENWLLASVDTDPASMLWYMQTDDAVKAYVKTTINPLIEAHEEIARKQGIRSVDDSLSFKRFRGMDVQFLAAARSNLISKRAQRIVGDEIDAYDPAFGDPKVLFDVRRQTYGADSMLLMISHPDRALSSAPDGWTAGIMSVYADSTRCAWYWPCPHCGGFSSPNPSAARVCRLVYPEDAPLEDVEAEARILCPSCGALIEDHHRRAMNREGIWIGRGQDIDQDGKVRGERQRHATAGYWITGMMSPFLLRGIGGLARARVEAERAREMTGDDTSLREVIVKQWGVPYDPPRRVGSLDANALADRAEQALALGVVPSGARFLTAFCDVQANRFELLTRAWGPAGESWVIDHRVIPADPTASAADWDALLALLSDLAYPLSDGSERSMQIRGAGYDTGGAPGTTAQAYDAWRRAHQRRKIRLLGTMSGRDVHTITPTKGIGGLGTSRLQVVYPDSARRDREAKARGNVPLAQFAANWFKDALAGQLMILDPGQPWSVHFPAALRSPAPPHLWFEQLTAEQRRPNGVWDRMAGRANEALDLMVGTHVVAHLHGLSRIEWTRPPPWASEWDRNPLVTGTPAAEDPSPSHAAAPDLRAVAPIARPAAAPARNRFARF